MRKLAKLVAASILGISCLAVSSLWAQEKINYPIAPQIMGLTESEKLVLKAIASGERADLMRRSGEKEEKGQIRGKFLQALLTSQFSGFTVHHHGVQISNAKITGKLDVRNAEVPFNVSLRDCDFQEEVNFQDAVFRKNLEVDGSHFHKEAHFLKTKVDMSGFFRNCLFKGRVNFGGANFGEAFNAERTRFETEEEIQFISLKVGTGAYFNKAEFWGPVYFSRAKVGDLQMTKADFSQRAEFQNLKVDYDALFQEAKFNGGVNLGGASIGRDFKATGVQCLNKTEPASFLRLKVGHDAIFNDARFHGGVKFEGAIIDRDLKATGAQFLSKTKFASFLGLKVGHDADFTNRVVFLGPVDFHGADIGQEFKADGAEFQNEGVVEAISLKVGIIASFNHAIFNGRVSFSGATIGGQFNAVRAQFTSSDKEVDFSGLKVGHLARFTDAFFAGPVNFVGAEIGGELRVEGGQESDSEGAVFGEGVVFRGKVSLEDARLSDLSLRGSEQKPLVISELNLERLVVERNLTIANASLGILKAWSLQGKGQTTLTNVKITEKADLRDTRFLNLKIPGVQWPQRRDGTILSGLTYQSVRAVEAPVTRKDWEPVIEWVANSKFDKRNYLQLETYLERSGYDDLADRVYILMKRRELLPQGWVSALNPLIWPKLLLWDFLAGYGRYPRRVLWVCLGFVLFGAIFIFKADQFSEIHWPRKWQIDRRHKLLARFLYSFEQFTPMVNLGMDSYWKPKEMPTRLLFYIYFHRLCGWVLIPIGLAALYTQFK